MFVKQTRYNCCGASLFLSSQQVQYSINKWVFFLSVYTYIDELMSFVACIGGVPTECCCAIGKTISACYHWLVWHMLDRAPTACTIHPAPLRACGTHALCKTEIGPGFPRSRNQLWLLELSPVPTAHATCGSGCWFAEAFGADELGMLQLTGAMCT